MMKTLMLLRNIACVCLGLVFFTSGMAKLYAGHAFPGIIGPVWLEDELAKFGLGLFARFVATGQVLVGFLLLTLRFSTLGAVMLVPVVLNILVVTISLEWRGTPWVVAFFLASNLFVLAVDYRKLLPLIGYGAEAPAPAARLSWQGNLLWFAGMVFVLASIGISFFQLELGWLACFAGLCMAWSGRFPDRRAERLNRR
ncbi:MAG: hypothetical protein IPM36_02590 [Lewinellaceae bacterium]|nr:hypothetical protein [Lewinellaceae bacterium]